MTDELYIELRELLTVFPSICVKAKASDPAQSIWIHLKVQNKLVIYSPLLRQVAYWSKQDRKMRTYATKEYSHEPGTPIPNNCISINKLLTDYDKENDALPKLPPKRLGSNTSN
ncbi:hypothetical protein SOM24_02645 [Pantoea agglomerans]|jgi:hypothetical protein|uniref:hypothetical protein n=1 Tax=Enterobacter agglomerans TaxID=549 RepID=UPI00177C59CE|nr:hypothetical protein [Pantoea agglomerans]MBD8250880.1 hypothetical protein [Pantoea agglomerans]MDY0997392.1 hypothetical protein [Pantoea agglomerans]WAB85959.1 hypothetical protein OSE17_12465 [Pantoea agglomerans]